MKRLLVGLDVDGVIADFIGASLDYIEKKTGHRPAREDCRSWLFLQDIVDHQLAKSVMDELWTKPGLAMDLELLEGAKEGVQRLQAIADVRIITSPSYQNPTWTFDRTRWLEAHLGIRHGHCIHTDAKQYVDVDVFVDDKPEHIRNWVAERRARALTTIPPWRARGLLWDSTTNRQAENSDLVRITSWDRLYVHVATYTKTLNDPRLHTT